MNALANHACLGYQLALNSLRTREIRKYAGGHPHLPLRVGDVHSPQCRPAPRKYSHGYRLHHDRDRAGRGVQPRREHWAHAGRHCRVRHRLPDVHHRAGIFLLASEQHAAGSLCSRLPAGGRHRDRHGAGRPFPVRRACGQRGDRRLGARAVVDCHRSQDPQRIGQDQVGRGTKFGRYPDFPGHRGDPDPVDDQPGDRNRRRCLVPDRFHGSQRRPADRRDLSCRPLSAEGGLQDRFGDQFARNLHRLDPADRGWRVIPRALFRLFLFAGRFPCGDDDRRYDLQISGRGRSYPVPRPAAGRVLRFGRAADRLQCGVAIPSGHPRARSCADDDQGNHHLPDPDRFPFHGRIVQDLGKPCPGRRIRAGRAVAHARQPAAARRSGADSDGHGCRLDDRDAVPDQQCRRGHAADFQARQPCRPGIVAQPDQRACRPARVWHAGPDHLAIAGQGRNPACRGDRRYR